MEFSQNGFNFSTEHPTAKMANGWANKKGVDVVAFVAEDSKGAKTIVLFDTKTKLPIFESQSLEAVAVHIDILALAKDAENE
jgi:hypothetical protein